MILLPYLPFVHKLRLHPSITATAASNRMPPCFFVHNSKTKAVCMLTRTKKMGKMIITMDTRREHHGSGQ
jgi:hypothetical protein